MLLTEIPQVIWLVATTLEGCAEHSYEENDSNRQR
jgi:hypothetical protein